MQRTEIVITGSAGQGIQLLGEILAKALIREGKKVSLSSLYGSAVRAGVSFSFLVASDDPIDYPLIMKPDIVVVISKEAWQEIQKKWQINPETIIIFNSDAVEKTGAGGLAIPANKLSPKAPNMVMLGFLVAETELCQKENLARIIEEFGKNKDENLAGLEAGFQFSKKEMDI